MRVHMLVRTGAWQPGATVDVDETTAKWLIAHRFARAAGSSTEDKPTQQGQAQQGQRARTTKRSTGTRSRAADAASSEAD